MIRLNIVNDATGTPEVGNYIVELIMPERGTAFGWHRIEVEVKDFHRDQGWAALMREALAALEAAPAAAPERPA